METSLPPKVVKLTKLLCESKRIINAQRSHFLTLSFLFILLPSVAAVVHNMLLSLVASSNSFLSYSSTTLSGQQQDQPSFSIKTLLIAVAYGLFNSVFSLTAVGSITYSVIHGFHGQPLKLESAIKSMSTSFLRLLATNLLVQIIFFSITSVFVVVFAMLIVGAQLAGFRIEYSSPYLVILCFVMLITLFLVMIYLQVNWSLSSIVVVAETTWGFASLKRSWSLIKGRRCLALSLSLFFWLLSAAFGWLTSYSALVVGLDHNGVSSDDEWKWLIFPLAIQVVAFSTVRTVISLYDMVSNAVLYVSCSNVVVEEYISLGSDDEKVSGLVYYLLPKDDYEV